jgi:SNF2 family DNA or RNA helicase
VRVRTRTYLVESTEPSAGHGTLVRLACLDDDAQGQELTVIWEVELDREIVGADSWRSIGSKGFDSPRAFGAYIHTLRWNCVTATDPKLFQSPFRAGIRLDAYQLEPLRKALLLPRVNLFIADDVGLGKTIEAGLIATELLLRRRVREIVVACPPSMLLQWKDEMEARFGLLFEILDRDYVQRVRRERGYGVNPWETYPRFLVSHRLLIDEAYAGPLRDWLGVLRPATLLILDEAHHAAPSSGAKYAIDSRITRAVREIASRFEHRLFLSATPHNGHSNSFSALLELLDNQRFTRGVKVLKSQLDAVMVRRLKDDIRQLSGGFPERKVTQIDISGLPDDAPELKLAALLDEYRQIRQLRTAGLSKRKQAEAALLISGLQQRLLSSIEAFARTLSVHRRTMERLWATGEEAPATSHAVQAAGAASTSTDQLQLIADAPGSDDDLATVPEEDFAALEDAEFQAATESTLGEAARANVSREKELLAQMESVAESARGLPDQRVCRLIDFIRDNMCAGARLPGEPSPKPGAPWSDLRILIFTEYEDTRRYVVNMLRAAIAETKLAEFRIDVFHGPTPPDKREAIKRAFNLPPSEHPVRILVATDAAREGLNLQAHCHNLFHFDVPWNPARLEQRNGRIDRKLQPSPEVYCYYFVYTQRPEDRVLRTLVEKTKRIRKELGSLSEVLEARLSEMLRLGIRHQDVDKIEAEIEAEGLNPEKQETVEEELETIREHRNLQRQIDELRTRINAASKWIGLDYDSFRDALSCALELLKAEPLKSIGRSDGGPERFQFPNLAASYGADPSWATTLDALRTPPKEGGRDFKWRKESPIRPVVFRAPDQINDEVVQIHLQHRVAQRLLGRFLAQGFVSHDLSRACLVQTEDAIPRVVLLGRLSLYGRGAVRLHEEILTVSARWSDPTLRRGPLKPYGREAETKTLDLMERALKPEALGHVPEAIHSKLISAVQKDLEELLPHLETAGQEARDAAAKDLAQRGASESEAMRKMLEDQRTRVQTELGKRPEQLTFQFDDAEKRQLESNRRYWHTWLDKVEVDLQQEPQRIIDFYSVASFRIEPIGLAYLWPVTG